MELFQSSIDLMRVVFLVGAVLALIWKKVFGLTPGGIIIPGTLAIILDHSMPLFLLTLLLSVTTYAVYKYGFSDRTLTKRESIMAMISVSAVLSLISLYILTTYFKQDISVLFLSMVAPGLIALAMNKYGFNRSMTSTLIVTAVTYCLGWLLASTIPFEVLSFMTVHLGAYVPLTIANPYVIFPISIAVSILLYKLFNVRSGGYIIAPILIAVAFSSPIQALLLALAVAVSYFSIYFIQKFTLIIGLERFVASLVMAYLTVSMIDLIASSMIIEGYRSASIILMVAVAVIVNDLSLQPIKDSLAKGMTPSLLLSYVTRLAV